MAKRKNNIKSVGSDYRHTERIEIGGAILPSIKCTRKDLGVCVFALTGLTAAYFCCKYGLKRWFTVKPNNGEEKKNAVPDPPKVEVVADCINNAGEPKKALLPDMIIEGGLSVFAGREGAGKTLLGHQAAIELARGYGVFVANGITPQNVIIVDGEMDDDDYVERFKDMDIPSNIVRIHDTSFENLEQLSEYIEKVIATLTSPTTIFFDNLVALSIADLTGKAVNKFFRDLKRIQRNSKTVITFVVVDHVGKSPEGRSLDNSFLAGSANIARYAHNVIILDLSARSADHRYIKFTKQRKAARPDEVLEVVISEEEYLHFEVVGQVAEADVIRNKTNLKRYSQEPDSDNNATDDNPKLDEKNRRAKEIRDYIDTLDCATKEERIKMAADHFGCSERTIYNQLARLKK